MDSQYDAEQYDVSHRVRHFVNMMRLLSAKQTRRDARIESSSILTFACMRPTNQITLATCFIIEKWPPLMMRRSLKLYVFILAYGKFQQGHQSTCAWNEVVSQVR